ncbi:helix-turn-helix domain-containing protein [Dyadobacter sp. 50-39]|uniref:helix-turn-helix domain-containing protein n=1 Tax=Dyadobacter sp. 50-39 TaxID=1895756 RepID=UPI000ABE78F0|nr:helix-turn-helix domain-containing protein [Dyadobacter sp. 50-39]
MDELEKINPFHILAQRLTRIEHMLVCLMENTDVNPASISPQQPELLSITEAARFLGLSKQAVYRHIGKISHYKRNGRLYFKRQELIEYVEQGRRIARKSLPGRH